MREGGGRGSRARRGSLGGARGPAPVRGALSDPGGRRGEKQGAQQEGVSEVAQRLGTPRLKGGERGWGEQATPHELYCGV